MQNLLTWNFWFNFRPEPLLPLFRNIYLGLLVLLLLLAVFTYFKQNKKGAYRKFWKQVYFFSFSNLIIGVIFFFFNYERASFLSARFWLALWVIVMLAWLYPLLKTWKKVPINKKRLEEEESFKKYLP